MEGNSILDFGFKCMNKLKFWVFNTSLFIFILLILYGIGTGQTLDKEGKMDAQALWRYMTIENPYQNYPTWPGKEGFYESTMPPGNILKLYVNDIALETIVNKKGVFSDGALLIKENYTDDKKLFLITVMYKSKGFNPAGHDWYWVKYKPDGEARLEGKVDACIDCHVGVANNDYVFTGSIK